MGDIEQMLRQALADDAATVTPPPDLAGRVGRRHQRRQRRVRAAVALGGLAVLITALPVVLMVEGRGAPVPPAAAAVDAVGGVELTYLPDGLLRDPVDGYDYGGGRWTERGWTGWTAVTGRWWPGGGQRGPDHSGVRVTVYRGEYVDALTVLARPLVASFDALPPDPGDRLELRTPIDSGEGEWVDVFWRADDEATVRVRVSDDLMGDLERIIEGVRVVGPGESVWYDGDAAPPANGGFCAPETNRHLPAASRVTGPGWDRFGGVDVGYLPDALSAGGLVEMHAASGLVETAEAGRWSYRYAWRFPADDSWPVTVRVTCGHGAPQDRDQLRSFVAASGTEPLTPEPYQLPGGQPAFRVDDHFDGMGARVAWLVWPGAVVEVSMTQGLVDELDEVVANVDVVPG